MKGIVGWSGLTLGEGLDGGGDGLGMRDCIRMRVLRARECGGWRGAGLLGSE